MLAPWLLSNWLPCFGISCDEAGRLGAFTAGLVLIAADASASSAPTSWPSIVAGFLPAGIYLQHTLIWMARLSLRLGKKGHSHFQMHCRIEVFMWWLMLCPWVLSKMFAWRMQIWRVMRTKHQTNPIDSIIACSGWLQIDCHMCMYAILWAHSLAWRGAAPKPSADSPPIRSSKLRFGRGAAGWDVLACPDPVIKKNKIQIDVDV